MADHGSGAGDGRGHGRHALPGSLTWVGGGGIIIVIVIKIRALAREDML